MKLMTEICCNAACWSVPILCLERHDICFNIRKQSQKHSLWMLWTGISFKFSKGAKQQAVYSRLWVWQEQPLITVLVGLLAREAWGDSDTAHFPLLSSLCCLVQHFFQSTPQLRTVVIPINIKSLTSAPAGAAKLHSAAQQPLHLGPALSVMSRCRDVSLCSPSHAPGLPFKRIMPLWISRRRPFWERSFFEWHLSLAQWIVYMLGNVNGEMA